MWTADKADVLTMASVVDSIPSRPGLPTSLFFQVEPKKKNVSFKITAEATAEVMLPGDGHWPQSETFYLDRRMFLPFVLAAKDLQNDHPFEFTAKEKQLVVRNGKGRVGWFDCNPTIHGYGFPHKSDSVSVLQLDDKLRGLIYGARECATADIVTPQLNCVYIEPTKSGVEVLATNQKLMFRGVIDTKMKVRTHIPLPLQLVQLLGSPELQQVRWKEKSVELVFPNGRIWQSVSHQARKSFPADVIRKYMDEGNKAPVVFKVPSKRLAHVLDRLCFYLTSVRRQDWSLKMSGKKNEHWLTLTTNVATSRFQERVKLDRPLKVDVAMDWPLDMLEPIFAYLNTQKDVSMTVRVNKLGRSFVQSGPISLVIPRKKK